jgi:hypothetical protein
MVYEKCIISTGKIKLWIPQHLVENKAEIMRQVLKMQYISLLQKYIKLISMVGLVCVFTYVILGHSVVKYT